MDIAANKFDNVRAGLAMSSDQAFQGRHDDDINVLCFAADFIDQVTAMNVVKTFLSAEFGKEERYTRRLQKIARIEEGE